MSKETTKEITKGEQGQIVKWVLVGVGSFFIYGFFNDKIKGIFPDGGTQLIIGIMLIVVAAYFFNLNKF